MVAALSLVGAPPVAADEHTSTPIDIPPELAPDPETGTWPDDAPRWADPPAAHADAATAPAAVDGAGPILASHATGLTPSPGATLGGLQSLPPVRLLDTRFGLGASGAVGPGQSVDVAMLGHGGVPAGGVGSVVVNITVTQPSVATFVTAYPAGEPRPTASVLNAVAGQTLPNLAIVKLGAGGQISLYNNDGTAHLVVDVMGWAPLDAHVTALSPARLLDTRDSGVPVGPAAIIDVPVSGRGGVPATGAGAVVVNITATEPTTPTHVTAWPAGEPIPLASNLNVTPGETFPNLAIVKLGATGAISLYNNAGSTHLVVDVMGWLPPEGSFVPLSPVRVLDTRIGTGGAFGPVGGFGTIVLDLASRVDSDADGVFLNVTAVDATADTFITVYPTGTSVPVASNVNPTAGETVPNLVFVPLSSGGQVSLYNNAGSVHLVADLVGVTTRRNGQDDPDAGSSVVVHAVYVRPAGVVAPPGRVAEIAHELENMDAWLMGQAPGRRVTWDRSGGQIEVSETVLRQTLAEIHAAGPSFGGRSGSLVGLAGIEVIESQLAVDGFGHPDKVYLVIVESVFTGFICGVVLGNASNDVTLEGPIGAPRYAHLFIAASCDDPSTTSLPGTSEAAVTGIHELFHAVGAVPPCGATDNGEGHVSTNGLPGTDLMGPFVVTNPVLDPGRNDYWGHGLPACPDLERSPYVMG